MNILIVEDNDESRNMLESLLKGRGYDVISATNGVEAIERLKKERFDMIISDILMPKMDGFSLCRKCKSDDTLRKIPFVFYTATYTDKKDEEFALSLGAEKFIVKPVEPDKFLEILEAVIEEHEAGTLAAPKRPVEDETVYLAEYNKRLIEKLEHKALNLEKELAERKRAEKALRESEGKYRTLFETASDAIILVKFSVGQGARFLDCNSRALEMLGCTREQLIGKSPEDFSPPTQPDGMPTHEKVLEIVKATAQGKPQFFEWTHRRLDGTSFPAEVTLNYIEIHGETYIQAVTRDIVQRQL